MQMLRGCLLALLVFASVHDASAQIIQGRSSGGSAQGLQENFTIENEITTATSANPLIVGNNTQKLEIFGDATMGGVIRPNPLGDSIWRCWTNFNCLIRDEEAGATVLTIDPDAASKLLMYQFGANYRPLKSVYLDARFWRGDGTNCPATPTLVTISNMPEYSYVCTENNSSRMRARLPMPPNWDAVVIYVEPHYSQTAADTGSVLLDVAAACRAFGTAFNGTYGTEVNVDDAALVGSGAIESTLSGAITPNGTCASSNNVFIYIDVDGTGNPTTAAATLNFLGARVYWSETSLSH